MKLHIVRIVGIVCALFIAGWGGAGTLASDTTRGAPIDLPCAHDVTAEILGRAVPADAGGLVQLSVRVTIAPGGGFDAHTHPGTVIATIDSGSFGFIPLDDMEMTITRAADPGTPAVTETVGANEEVLLGPGDWFVETGMVHEAWNRGEEPVVVIISALIQPDQPLTQCVS